MQNNEGVSFANISASTSAFELKGGKYALSAVATFGGGSVKLQKLLPDGSTYASVASATDLTAAGYGTADIPPGKYRLTITTATAVFADVVRIPMN